MDEEPVDVGLLREGFVHEEESQNVSSTYMHKSGTFLLHRINHLILCNIWNVPFAGAAKKSQPIMRLIDMANLGSSECEERRGVVTSSTGCQVSGSI